MSETAEHSPEQPVDYSVEKQLARTVTVTLGWWAHGAVRLVLAVAMLYYGYAKLVLGQFGVADMGDALIAQGEMSPMGVLWRMVAFSPLFQVLAGSSMAHARAHGAFMTWARFSAGPVAGGRAPLRDPPQISALPMR